MIDHPVPLDYSSFKKAVENISLLEKTGTLDIRDKKTGQSYYFYIKNGEIIYIEEHPVCLENRIGDTLLRQGLITETQLQKALEKQKKNTYEFLGDLLLKEGYISPRELLASLTYQIENVLFSISLIREGEFVFREGETPERMPQIPYKITLSKLLLIFLKSSEILVKMPFLIEGLDISLRIDSVAVNIHQLNPMEQSVIDDFRKGRAIREILENAGETNHINMLSVIADLYDRNILRPPGESMKSQSETAPSAAPEEAPEKETPVTPPEKKPETENPAPQEKTPASRPRYTEEPIQFVYKPEPQQTPVAPAPPPQREIPHRPAPRKRTPAPPRKRIPPPRPAVSPSARPPRPVQPPRPGTYALVESLSFISVLFLLILYLALLKPLFKTPVTDHLSIMNPEAFREIKKERTLQMGTVYTRDELLNRRDGWHNPFSARGEDIYSSGADGIPYTPDDFRVK